jgi:YVTN family beta-propeller protein
LQFNIWGVQYDIPLSDDAHPWSVWGLPWQRSTTFRVVNYSGSKLTWIMYQPYYNKQVGGYTYTYPGGHAGEDFTMYLWTDCGKIQLQGVIDDPTPTPGPPQGMPFQVWTPLITSWGVGEASPPASPTPTATPTPQASYAAVSGLNIPNDVAYDAVTNRIYIANRGDNTVQMLDAADYRSLANIPVCKAPFGVAVNTRTNRIYATCAGDNKVAVIDGVTQRMIKEIPVGAFPTYLVVDESANRVYVSSRGANVVTEINGNSNEASRILHTSTGVFGLALNQAQKRLYAGFLTDNIISVIDLDAWRVVRNYQANAGGINGSVFALGFNPVAHRLYATYRSPGVSTRLAVFQATADGLARVATIQLPDGGDESSGRLGVDELNGHIYISNAGADSVTVLDGVANRILATVPVHRQPFGIVANSRNGKVYVGARASNQLWVVPDTY